MPDIGDGEMDAANHIAIYVTMQQSCMIGTCTSEPKVLYIYKESFGVNVKPLEYFHSVLMGIYIDSTIIVKFYFLVNLYIHIACDPASLFISQHK